MSAMPHWRKIAASQLSTPLLTFGCDLRFPESGHMFRRLVTAEIGTLPPFVIDVSNGSSCQKSTSRGLSIGIAEQQKV